MISFPNPIQAFITKHKLQFIIQILYFAVITYFFHWLWWDGGLESWLRTHAFFNETEEFLAHQVFLPASWIVEHVLRYPIHTEHNTLFFANNGYIAVEGSCSGLKQFYQWFFLMLLFPGPWKRKLWYIPLGIVTIHLYNILRIVILSVVIVHWPAHWGFIHHWVMRPLYYGVIFILWVLWVEKIGKRDPDRRSQ
ncbi:MAG: archaeosortase/exosortase family protein [Bacteroidales bacterium]|nr:archaeosortase/exosortase family protein [Bacteroidales bacterium]